MNHDQEPDRLMEKPDSSKAAVPDVGGTAEVDAGRSLSLPEPTGNGTPSSPEAQPQRPVSTWLNFLSIHERLIALVLGIAGFILSVATFTAVWRQTGAMLDQNEQIIKQTDSMLAQTRLAAKQVEMTKEQVELLKVQVSDAKASGAESDKLAREAMALSQRQSEASMSLASETNKLELRAWVGPERVSSHFLPGEPSQIDIFYRNSGRTPAVDCTINVVVLFGAKTSPPPLDPSFESSSEMNVTSRTFFMPNAVFSSTIKETMSREQYERLQSGEWIAYLHARASYVDVFRVKHIVRSCYYYSVTHKEWHSCGQLNEMDLP